MCLVSGALYGANFAPVIYIKNNYPKLNISEECTVDPCVEKVSQKGGILLLIHCVMSVCLSLVVGE